MKIIIDRNKLTKIVLFLSILIFGVYLAGRYFSFLITPQPEMTLIIKYKQVPPVIEDILRMKLRAFYRGYSVGQVSKIDLSEDQEYILFYLDIYYKNLKLPKNTKFFLDSEDLYGARHFSIYYPDNPSSQFLSNGDVICGTGAYERIDKYLVRDMQSGKLSKLISNLVDITGFLKEITKNKNIESGDILLNLNKSSNEVQVILKSLREIIDDPQIKREIKSTIKASSKSINNINKILETKEIKQTLYNSPELINKTINNLDSINNNLANTNQILPKVNNSHTSTNCNLKVINAKVPIIPSDLLSNTNKVLKKADCLIEESVKILSQKFLGLKFLFGKPASSLNKCSECKH